MPSPAELPVPPTTTEEVDGSIPTALLSTIRNLSVTPSRRMNAVLRSLRRPERSVAPVDAMAMAVIAGVASSEIEDIHATVPQTLLALLHPAHPAVTMAGRSAAEAAAATAAAVAGRITYADHSRAHARLMAAQNTPEFAGGPRRMNVRVGSYVAPHSSRVPNLLADLAGFVSIRRSGSVAAAAIAHGQFECIHPYPDGNGRIGRALLSGHLGIPVGVHLGRLRNSYFWGLDAFRFGDAGTLAEIVAEDVALMSVYRDTLWQSEDDIRLSAQGQEALAALRSIPVRLGTSASLFEGAGMRELHDAGLLMQVSDDLGEQTVWMHTAVNDWASMADTDQYGARSLTRTVRMRRV